MGVNILILEPLKVLRNCRRYFLLMCLRINLPPDGGLVGAEVVVGAGPVAKYKIIRYENIQ